MRPHAVARFAKAQRFDPPLPGRSKTQGGMKISTVIFMDNGAGPYTQFRISFNGNSPEVLRKGAFMEEKRISIIRKQIGDAVYIVESVVSTAAKETAYDKVKRLILNDTDIFQKKAS